MPEQKASRLNGKVVVYFVTEDWYFCSHRIDLAVAAVKSGYIVHVITRVSSHGEVIRSAGLNLIPLNLQRRSKNLIAEASIVLRLIKLYRFLRPDIVHHVAMKPVIYGSVAALVARVPVVVNALAGLGYLFSSDAMKAKLLRPFIKSILRRLLDREGRVLILQNPDDVDLMIENGLVRRKRVRLIRGSGVDTERYRYTQEAEGVRIVILPSRMLWDKGVAEFVEAARIIKNIGVNVRFVLAGEVDDQNPLSISTHRLSQWHEEGHIEWWGKCSDMPDVFSRVHIVCLPSYREGVPKVLIEAASCGRPIVTTDAPGCREIVKDGVNGILVPVKSVNKLASAIVSLLESSELRHQMGIAGRRLVQEEFSLAQVSGETLDLYGSLSG